MAYKRLTRIEGFRLYNWMNENVGRFENMSLTEVTKLARKELKSPEFESSKLNNDHITAARNDLGLTWALKDQSKVDGRKKSKEATIELIGKTEKLEAKIESGFDELKSAIQVIESRMDLFEKALKLQASLKKNPAFPNWQSGSKPEAVKQ